MSRERENKNREAFHEWIPEQKVNICGTDKDTSSALLPDGLFHTLGASKSAIDELCNLRKHQ